MADEGDSLLREVEQELRRERLEKFWNKYSGVVVAATAALVLGIGGYSYMRNTRIQAAEAAGAAFSKAMAISGETAKTADKLAALEAIAKSESGGYATLAKLHIAGAKARSGKRDEAMAVFNEIAGDSKADPLLRDYAKLEAATLDMGKASFTETKNRLTPLTEGNGAYRNTANELLGVAAYKAGDYEAARGYLEPLLIDPDASRDVQDRIKIVLGEIAAAELAKTGNKASKTTESPVTKAAEGQAKGGDAAPASASTDAKDAKPAATPPATPDKK